jgi:hypothetical protein
LQKNICAKAGCKMLMKLTIELLALSTEMSGRFAKNVIRHPTFATSIQQMSANA